MVSRKLVLKKTHYQEVIVYEITLDHIIFRFVYLYTHSMVDVDVDSFPFLFLSHFFALFDASALVHKMFVTRCIMVMMVFFVADPFAMCGMERTFFKAMCDR